MPARVELWSDDFLTEVLVVFTIWWPLALEGETLQETPIKTALRMQVAGRKVIGITRIIHRLSHISKGHA